MPFAVNDHVVHPGIGLGRIVALVTRSMLGAEARLYYEVSGERSTIWVPVDPLTNHGLRRLTRRDELTHYREVVAGPPMALNPDHRQRQTDMRLLLKLGTVQGLCEMIRDLSARSWFKPLNEGDTQSLRRSREALAQEWAAAAGVTVPQASAEISGLLLAGRHTYHV